MANHRSGPSVRWAGITAHGSRIAVLVLCLCTFALGIKDLGAHTLWLDEAIYMGRTTLGLIPVLLAQGQDLQHPPLYQLIVSAWVSLAGTNPFAGRFPALIGAVLLVPLTNVFARRLFPRSNGVLAAGFVAFSPLLLYHAQEVKSVTLAALWGLLSMYTFVVAIERNRRRDWVWYVVASVAALLTFYLNTFVVLAQALFLLWHRDRIRAFWKRLTLAWGAIAAIYGAWFVWVLLVNQPKIALLLADRSPDSSLSVSALLPFLDGYVRRLPFVPDTLAALVTGYVTPLKTVILALLLILALLASGLWPRSRQWPDRTGPRLLLLTLAVYLGLAYVMGAPIGFYHARYHPVLVPTIAVLTAAALSLVATWRRWMATLLGSSLIGCTVLAALGALWATPRPTPNFPPSTYLPVVQYVNCQSRPGDALVVDHVAWAGFFVTYGQGPTLPWDQPGLTSYGSIEETLSRLVQNHPRLWAITTEGIDSAGHKFESWLDKHAYLAADIPHANCSIGLYGTTSSMRATQRPAFVFGRTMQLMACEPDTGTVVPGQVLGLDLAWRCLTPVDRDYHVSLRLVDANGDLVSQCDRQPTNGQHPTSTWQAGETIEDRVGLLIPWDRAPGRYTVYVVVYDLASGQPLDALEERGTPLGDSAPLGTAQVGPGTYYPPAACLSPTRPLSAQFGDLQLLGCDLRTTDLRPGDRLPLVLYWQARNHPMPDYTVRVRLVGEDAVEGGQQTGWPVGDTYPTSTWPPGAVVRDRWAVPVAAGATSGRYQVLVQATAAASGVPGSAEVSCGTVQVNARPYIYDAPPIPHPQAARFGDGAELLGYSLAADGRTQVGDELAVRPGEALSLTLFWQCRAEMDTSYTVFVHVLDADDRPWAGRDGLPCEADCPTSGWVTGEMLTDTRVIPIPADMPSGTMRLEIGLYDARTGKRLPAFDTTGQGMGDRVLLDVLLHVGGEAKLSR